MVQQIARVTFKDHLDQHIGHRLYDGLLVIRAYIKELETQLSLGPVRADNFGICLIRKGSLRISINFTTYELGPDEVIFLSPMMVVQVLAFSEDIEICTMLTDFDLFHKIGLPIYKAYTMECVGHKGENVVAFDRMQAERFFVYFNNLEHQNTLQEGSMFQVEIIKMTLMLLFYETSAKISGNVAKKSVNFEHKNRLVLNFLNLAAKHFKVNRSVQFYADQLFISRKHLSRVVKEVTGLGPKVILDEIVVSEAVMLLNVSSMTVKDVMNELGFSDFGTFSKFFKSYLGKSPLAYRNQIEGKEIS